MPAEIKIQKFSWLILDANHCEVKYSIHEEKHIVGSYNTAYHLKENTVSRRIFESVSLCGEQTSSLPYESEFNHVKFYMH